MNVAEKERLSVGDDNDLTFGKTMVVKSGKTMGRRIGVFKNTAFSRLKLMNHFVIENDITRKPLGIAYAYLSSQTAVCRIKEIIKKLGLTIVKYRSSPLLNISEDKGSKMEDLTENFSSLSGGSM